MMQLLQAVRRTAFATGFVAVLGCGGGKVARPFEVVPVSGVVTYNGQQVEGASVTFHPADGGGSPLHAGKPSARDKTDAQGRFRLWTFDLNDGAVPGDHVVTVSKVEIVAPDVDPDAPGYNPATAPAEAPPRFLVPEKYGNRTSSGLTATVSPTGENVFEFALQN